MSPTRRNRRRLSALLVLALLVMPILEIYVLIQVGQAIGPWWTVLLLLADSIFGAWLIKREGRRAWRAMRSRLETGAMPTKELADGVLIVLGGALMMSPGFVSDAIGILLILPLTRPLFRRLLAGYAMSRLVVTQTRPGPSAQDTVIRGEVIDERPD
ncbi:FxsA family protein [Nocardioides sp. zg-ZUI104]|uniref:FxsA family protein n=1 Tax=Nocardioides faecalis TaxID=2803858 RepID=UPI001BCDFD08|nr:FxsA family protein [Nocardioides faecalis]MBS4753823.1 FxsA family protein [Nocardioides faecalis]